MDRHRHGLNWCCDCGSEPSLLRLGLCCLLGFLGLLDYGGNPSKGYGHDDSQRRLHRSKRDGDIPMAYRLILALLGLLVAFPTHADEFRGVKIAPEAVVKYDRAKDYGGWIDADGDGINTRHEVLIEESLAPVQMSTDGKSVESGLWFDPYTAKTFILPRDGGRTLIDIDHMVPLKEAHQSGAYKWTKKKRSDYANDLDNPGHLIAVDSSANRSKSDKDPAK